MLRRATSIWRTRASIADCSTVHRSGNAQRRCFARVVDLEDIGRGGLQDEHDTLSATAAESGEPAVVYMGIVSTRSPKTTTIQDLISQIKPEAVQGSIRQNRYPSLLTVLTTPSYAKYALSSELPVEVIERLGDNPTGSKQLDAIVAVVDRLPLPNGSLEGTEGLAYAFAPSRARLDTSTQVLLNESAQKPGTLSFQLPAATDVTTRKRDTVTNIQLPLAQTIFSNGLPSTMVHSRYQFDPYSGTLRNIVSQRLESQTVGLDFGRQATKLEASIPLVALTPLREVQHSMGNIIQKVSSSHFYEERLASKASGKAASAVAPNIDEEQVTVVPASQELEKAVSDYFKHMGIPPQPVQVWAVILTSQVRESLAPKAAGSSKLRKAIERLLSLEEDHVRGQWSPADSDPGLSSAILQIVRQGGRLCKVLSGGGGWGKKAGLLSLDPDVEYSTRDLRGETGWEFDFDGDDSFEAVQKQRDQALGEIVKEGDGVMFLLAPEDVQGDAVVRRNSHTTLHGVVTLGVVPSSIDNYASSSPGDNVRASKNANDIQHHPNFFGMLSEGGMAINVNCPIENTYTQSKMDVPHQRVSIIRPSEEDVGPQVSDQTSATK